MTSPSSDRPQKSGNVLAWLWREIKELLATAAVFVPVWLVFTTFAFELRSIPSESMVPALRVGDRVAVSKFAFGYNRYSVPFGLGTMIGLPEGMIKLGEPKQGDMVVFKHPNQDKVMIKRVIGMPGDRLQMREGKLWLNSEEVTRTFIKTTRYLQNDSGSPVTAREFTEALPRSPKSEVIMHEFANDGGRPFCLRDTPEFSVPEGHYFMMGDNRDNSEDSRAASGHPELAAQKPEEWGCPGLFGEPAIGFVPYDHLIGRADLVLFSLYQCKKTPGTDCLPGRVWKSL